MAELFLVNKVPTRYDITRDEMVPVTQEWVDQTGILLQRFGALREAAKQAQFATQNFLDAWRPEFEQKK